MLLAIVGVQAKENETGVKGSEHFRLRYVINIAELDSTFVDNNEKMRDIRDFLQEAANDSLIHITGVDFRGTASPDGSYEFNVWLSENRLRTFKELVKSYVDVPDSLIFAQSSDIPWDEFRQKVEESDLPKRQQILEIIDRGPKLVPWFGNRHIDHRLLTLKSMDNGQVWETLKKPILFDLRYGDATFYYTRLFPALEEIRLPMQVMAMNEVPDLLPLPPAPQLLSWTPNIYLKTNLLGWAAGSVNLGAEFDIAPHWSFNFPIYYCAWDYFKSTIKFRNFTIQPEFRYWPNAKGTNHGFFLGAHFGAMAFNFAVDGKYRYQDRKGRHPALGGGLAIGFRKAISQNQRWHLEFSAGAGVYHLDYDVFENTPNYKEGEWVRRKQKTWVGLDQLTLSIAYTFPQTKKTRIYQKGGEL